MRRLSRLSALLVALAALPASLFAQGGGTITGRVTGADTGQPIASATVTVEGASLRAVTDGQGRYTIRSVPAGNYTVSASTLGRESARRTTTVAADQTVTLDFTLASRAIALEGIVASATGEQQRAREVGSSVAQIDVAEDVPLAATNDLAQVLQGRAAGVTVLQAGGTSGTGSRIRIRGSASVSLNNSPLLIIDGVRADNGNGGIDVGGQTPNRLNDINPEDIENIEILRGPAASALYGTAAANGVILVTTRKGRAGATRWSFYTEQGVIVEPNEYPTNYEGFCTLRLDGNGLQTIPGCDTPFALDTEAGTRANNPNVDPARITVTLDSIRSLNPLEDSRTTVFADGSRSKYGASVTGGTDRATFYLSGDLEAEDGVYDGMNELGRTNLRANLRAQLRDNLDITVNSGFISSELELPQNDNNVLGVLPSAYLGGATVESAYGFFTVDQIRNLTTNQDVRRLIASTTANYRPLSWLSFNSTAGMDLVRRHDNQTTLPGRVPFGDRLGGDRTSNRVEIDNYTVTGNGTANYSIRENVTGQTSLGMQFDKAVARSTSAFGRGLIEGCVTLNCVATGFAVDEGNSDVRTIGAYVQQQFALNDRLFLTGALRGDDNSAFGTDFGFIVYPSLSASWVVAEEPWFPQVDFLSTLRLRASWGQAGLRPGFRTAETFLTPVAVTVNNVSVPGFTIGNIGNLDLKPERSSEIELGFDLGLLDERIGLEFTYYNKRSEDALISRPLAPSLGVNGLGQVVNVGEVSNKGLEAALNLRLVRAANFEWDAHITATRTKNELLELGKDPTTGTDLQPIIFGLGGDTQRHQEGFPLGAYFQHTYTFEDANNDGIIAIDEVQISEDPEYLGTWSPTREASFQTNLTLFRYAKLSGLLDYRGGFKNYNGTEDFRCSSSFNCAGGYAGYEGGPNPSLEEQARAVAIAYGGAQGITTAAGYIEDASFVKLREVALTLGLPESLARRLRAQGLSLTLAGRNLKTWTDYSGIDPEVNTNGSGANFNTAEFLSQPPVRYWTARIDVNF
jgi:TonB-dependent starch-binding outer membrane protein SusC